jgi:hypothetical protein
MIGDPKISGWPSGGMISTHSPFDKAPRDGIQADGNACQGSRIAGSLDQRR